MIPQNKKKYYVATHVLLLCESMNGISSFVKIYIVLCCLIMLKIFLFLCIDHQIGTMEQPWLEELREMRGIRCNLSFTVSFRKIAKESTPVWHLEIERF